VALFRIAEQALDNAVQHSGATRIRLVLRASPRRTTLEIRDNGRGFDAARMRRRPRGLGLPLMESYAQDAGLVLEIASTPGRDTIVRITKDRAPGA
jgi:signal transduction histidine kinase